MGLPMFSFVILGSLGLQTGLATQLREAERLKKYTPPEDPEKVLKVPLARFALEVICRLCATHGSPEQGAVKRHWARH